MLMRLAEEFGFRVNTFTHVLEGYKVADEMAAHGASGMGFTRLVAVQAGGDRRDSVERLADVGPRRERRLQLRRCASWRAG